MANIYFDHAATTPTHPEVLEKMLPYFSEEFGNPSSVYKMARTNKTAIDIAREQVAKTIGAGESEIYFTAGGTEADNWAILGTVEGYKSKGNHIITSAIEHHAVLHTCQYLEKQGIEVTYLKVNEDGLIDLEDLENAIKENTILITIMYANNEIGTIQNIKEIGAIARANKIVFHTDAVQAVGHIPIDVVEEHIDLLSISAHKLYGPKGIGALYVKKGIKLRPIIHGGGQERKRRAGTENVPGIVGFGVAIERACLKLEAESKRLLELRDYLVDEIMTKIPYSKLNGHKEQRLPNNANISFEFIEGESMLIMLDMKGFSASSGSACTSGSLDPSHVLLAIGLPHEKAHGSLRLSLGEGTTKAQIDALVEVLVPIVARLREMSPLYEDFRKNHEV